GRDGQDDRVRHALDRGGGGGGDDARHAVGAPRAGARADPAGPGRARRGEGRRARRGGEPSHHRPAGRGQHGGGRAPGGRAGGAMRGERGVRAVGVGLMLAVLVLAGGPPAVEAQASKVARVAMLSPGHPQNVEAFRAGLRELGWVEGQNLIVEARFAEWHYERLPALAVELVRWRPDVLYTNTTPGVLAAQQATRTIPIVV